MIKLFLLSTDGCHLCENAKLLLETTNSNYELVDIIDDESLVAKFGDKIPVLLAENGEQALYWPFDEHSIEEYKKYYGIS